MKDGPRSDRPPMFATLSSKVPLVGVAPIVRKWFAIGADIFATVSSIQHLGIGPHLLGSLCPGNDHAAPIADKTDFGSHGSHLSSIGANAHQSINPTIKTAHVEFQFDDDDHECQEHHYHAVHLSLLCPLLPKGAARISQL